MTELGIAAVMPLYNKRDYVLEAVGSVLQQTRPPNEFVIVDDGSTDGSGDLVAELYGHDPRVRLLRQANQGSGAARNAGIRETRSPLLVFLDADDKLLPKRLENQGAFMERNSSCMMSFVASISYNERTGETSYPPLFDIPNKDRFIRRQFFPEHIHIGTGSVVMVRREALDDVGLFDESLWKAVDVDLWLRIMVRFGFDYIPERLSWGRRGYPRSVEQWERLFKGTDVYFAKHRYTFGKGLRGLMIWRAAYASVLRRQSIWYFRQNLGRKAMWELLRAIRMWPFFNPKWVSKTSLEYFLGTKRYDRAVAAYRRIMPLRQKAESNI